MCLVYLYLSIYLLSIYLSVYLSIYLSNFLSISLYIWGCSQTKLEALYGMGTQANFDQKKRNVRCFLLSCYHLMNFVNIFPGR